MLDPQFDIVAVASDEHQRHSEGSILVLPDGRWLLGWSEYYDGFHDGSSARLKGMWSSDRGETWSEPFLLLENDGKCNVMNVCFALQRDGSIAMSHVRTDDETCYHSYTFFRKSIDGGQTWSPHEPMVDMETWRGFPANDRFLTLSSGRLLVPLGLNRLSDGDSAESFILAGYTDDLGETWQLSREMATVGQAGSDSGGASEPAVFEKKDGTVVFLIRTKLGTIYAAESTDGGETLSESYDTGIQSPAAPCIVGRIPSTGDLLLVWNGVEPEKPGSGGPRTPLTSAISRDDGETWGNFKELEPRAGRSHMYPTLTFDGDTALITYSQGEIDSVKNWTTNWHNTSLKLARVPVQWFYE